jgi:hypothetical protein
MFYAHSPQLLLVGFASTSCPNDTVLMIMSNLSFANRINAGVGQPMDMVVYLHLVRFRGSSALCRELVPYPGVIGCPEGDQICQVAEYVTAYGIAEEPAFFWLGTKTRIAYFV